jgi:outer membrane receptor for ferric coprogen and ferric-rhodotorulic acid
VSNESESNTRDEFKYNLKMTPYAGLVYTLTSKYSLYVSYADIHQSVGPIRQVDGRLLSPADGIVVETGVKGAWRDGLLNGSLALYGIQQRGLPRIDPRFPIGEPSSPGCCYLPQATTRSKGVDLELSGDLARGWLFGSGYTFNNNRKHWRAALSVDNVFDRVYYQTVGLPSSGTWYGEARNYRIRLDATF